MKSMNYLFLSFMALATLVACEKASEDQDLPIQFTETLTLKFEQTVEIGDNKLSVGFQDLVEESRCPKGTECFWEGRAVVNLSVQEVGEEADLIELVMHDGKPEEAIDTLNNYIYILLDVSPYPEVEQGIQKEDYTIELQVTKL